MLLALVLVVSSVASSLPDPKLTPGDRVNVSVKKVCTPYYTAKVRKVSHATALAVYKEYGIAYNPRLYEVDHLRSLEIDGSNDLKNLWPQSYTGLWNAHVKDTLENRLHRLVCEHKLSQKAAGDMLAQNWIEAYQKYIAKRPLGKNK